MKVFANLPQSGSMRLVMAMAFLAGTLTACGDGAGSNGYGNMPPPEVGVVTVQPRDLQLTTELPGRLESSRVAQVRARVTGVLLKRVFEEGSDVKEGQLLYKIAANSYEATLQSAQAQVAQAEAQLIDAKARATRYGPLVEANAVSQQEYDAAVAAQKSAEAMVAAGKAAVRSARINLEYASVTAPIAGRIGRSLVTEGALVSQQEGTHLATIQQIDPLYVNISQSAGEVLRMREALKAGQLERAGGDEAVQVEVLLESGQLYDQPGRLLFTDLSVDPGTGQVSLRAEVPNSDGMLLPGMYVRARLQQAKLENIVLLPLQAVTRGGANGDSVMVIQSDGSFQPRTVTVGRMHGKQWVILDGLETGEQVMVDGFMKLMPGVSKVKPVPFDDGEADAAPPPAAQSDSLSEDGAEQAAETVVSSQSIALR